MDQRLELQSVLEQILGCNHVYFQPPATVKMQYPCIVYNLEPENLSYADNKAYRVKDRYSLTLIERNPDSSLRRQLIEELNCSPDRYFIKDNLYHKIYTLYY